MSDVTLFNDAQTIAYVNRHAARRDKQLNSAAAAETARMVVMTTTPECMRAKNGRSTADRRSRSPLLCARRSIPVRRLDRRPTRINALQACSCCGQQHPTNRPTDASMIRSRHRITGRLQSTGKRRVFQGPLLFSDLSPITSRTDAPSARQRLRQYTCSRTNCSQKNYKRAPCSTIPGNTEFAQPTRPIQRTINV